jgi:hypothetical protein
LGFLCLTSIVGAVPMMLDSKGEPLQIPQRFLEHSPFHSFLIPGIILLAANGIFSLLVLFAILRRTSRYGGWVMLQGFVLVGWIAVEVAMLRMAFWPHYLYLGVGLVLILAGLALTTGEANERRSARSSKSERIDLF